MTITNDGATILKQMQVLHPAAKMVSLRVLVSSRQFCVSITSFVCVSQVSQADDLGCFEYLTLQPCSLRA